MCLSLLTDAASPKLNLQDRTPENGMDATVVPRYVRTNLHQTQGEVNLERLMDNNEQYARAPPAKRDNLRSSSLTDTTIAGSRRQFDRRHEPPTTIQQKKTQQANQFSPILLPTHYIVETYVVWVQLLWRAPLVSA